MENYPKPVTKETHKKILDYLDNSIYQIKGSDGKYGIGFFCSVKCHCKKVSVLIDSLSEKKGMLSGYTDTNKLVNIKADLSYMGKIVNVKITSVKTWSLDGEIDE